MFLKFSFATLAALVAALGAATTAQSAIITSFALPGGPAVPVSTPAPNNDNMVLASPNVFDLPVAPGSALVFNNLSPIDITFNVQQSGGTTEYFVRETILNNSGIAWTGFVLQLSAATVGGFPAAFFDFPNFDPTPTASSFTQLNALALALGWSTGLIPAGGTFDLTFSVDATNGQPLIASFELSQFPIAVPEPATGSLLVFGALPFLIRWRMRASAGG